MALDKNDVAQLKEAKDNGLTVDQIIQSAEGILARNELIQTLKDTWSQIYYRFGSIIDKNIEEIEKLSTPEEMLNFVIKESFWLYTKELAEKEARIKQEEVDRLKREETIPEENTENV